MIRRLDLSSLSLDWLIASDQSSEISSTHCSRDTNCVLNKCCVHWFEFFFSALIWVFFQFVDLFLPSTISMEFILDNSFEISLMIDTSRWAKIQSVEQICVICDMPESEDYMIWLSFGFSLMQLLHKSHTQRAKIHANAKILPTNILLP